ncbi:putative glycerophosphodiester phosphodiesterase [Helianthus annuus]|uniref:Glycerophosphodiester phosphodiesterase n=1 Tax=Helianthus annuus TaxID=4232 RepID=A0A251VRY3_HELAN|nr:putative glycerophosphodiester phosphodiesterase [Helianthus annuus]KAJ0452637.1 putative glycerophosphodiester phosphodiesterase [Helianthus annuus]KAJ0474545.1 putative glycerophosphodiester phosphodiesterase [Helianthus annuus]KAJ0650102.1 putative glycerophosphodiester phosphodiesterase [Helianthus annuus]KAJ0653874.1 putative glycerophosphodiester phosphodiesterase [Helianthus annuus]
MMMGLEELKKLIPLLDAEKGFFSGSTSDPSDSHMCCVNALYGVGILSTPYAVKEGGWVGLLLFLFGVLSFYTGILLRYCLDSQPGLETYPDIGQAAFGTTGRLIISIILYVELYACCVEYIIWESDNLSSLFPNAHLNLGGLILNSHYLFAIMIALAVLPTVWLRDMSVLSYISAGGVVASILAVGCLFWVGLVDNVGFQIETTKALNLSSFPVAIGLYGYCYSGHAVFPNIYTSMAKRSQYPMVLLTRKKKREILFNWSLKQIFRGVLKLFKAKTNRHEVVYEVNENICDALNSTISEISEMANSVVVGKESVFPKNAGFLVDQTDIVVKLQVFKLPVYVQLMNNEFISKPWDFFSDPYVEINSYVTGANADGVVTDYPATAARYRSLFQGVEREGWSIQFWKDRVKSIAVEEPHSKLPPKSVWPGKSQECDGC